MKNRQIDCERIRLRPVCLEDAADMYEYASDEENVRFVFERHEDLAATKRSIADYFMIQPAGKYGIELKEEQKMIGTIDIRVKSEHKTAEIGYTLNKRYWGKGYVPEAASAVLKLAFETMNLEKVYAFHDADNPSSGKVLGKLGMQQEGILRNHLVNKGKRLDAVYYGILKEEYFQRKEYLKNEVELSVDFDYNMDAKMKDQ